MARKKQNSYQGGGNAVQNLISSGALDSTMKTLGGMGGAAQTMGNLMLSNQDKMIAGMKSLEAKHADHLNKGNWQGLTYSFAVTNVQGKDMLAVLLLPYREETEPEQLVCGKPLDVKNLSQFIQMLVNAAGAEGKTKTGGVIKKIK